MSAPAGRRWRLALGAAVLIALIALVARDLDWRRALDAARAADPGWLAIALLLNAAALPITTARWLLLLPRGAHVAAGRMFEIVAVMTSVANGGPMLTGQAAGIHLLATRGGLGHAGAVSLTLLDQVAEGIAKLALVAAGILLVPGFPRAAGTGLALLVPALLIGLALLARSAERVAALGRESPAFRFLGDIARQLDALGRPARFGGAVALKLVQKSAEGLAIAAVVHAMGIVVAPWTVLGVLVAVTLSTLVAVTPANLGGYEGGAFLVYRAAGIEPGAALALALVQHAVYLIPLASTGWVLESARLWRGAAGRSAAR